MIKYLINKNLPMQFAVAKKEGVPDMNTNVGYQNLEALCPGKSRLQLSAITANCLTLDDNGQIECDSCLEGTKIVHISKQQYPYINKILGLYDNLITLDISVTRVILFRKCG